MNWNDSEGYPIGKVRSHPLRGTESIVLPIFAKLSYFAHFCSCIDILDVRVVGGRGFKCFELIKYGRFLF